MVEFTETRKQARIQNYLQGKALLEAALKNSNLEAEKRTVQQQAQSNGIAAGLGALAALLLLPKRPPKATLDPATADLTEAERLARYKQSERYQAYQSRMMEWHAEQERKRKEIEFLETADLTEAERLARYKQTAEYQARQARLQAWQREQVYQRYRQGERAEPQMQEQKSFWQKAGEWMQQKVVQPVQHVGTIVNALKPPQTAGTSKLAAPVKDESPPWWKWWEGIKTFVQEKIIAPAQQAWNQYVYQPIIQPAIHWWREDVPGWMKETALSLIPIVGDGWGLIRQGLNWAQKKPVDKLDVILSLAGLVLDFPWPQEGGVGGDITIAVLKGMNAAIPPGPAREVLTQLVKEGLKNPNELARILKASEALLKNERLLKILIDHPQALETVMRRGPDAVTHLGVYAEDFAKIAHIPGVDTLLKKLLSTSAPTLKGAEFELEFALKHTDEIEEMGRVLEVIHGGNKEIDFVLRGNVFVNVKNYDWNKYKGFVLQSETEHLIEQARSFLKYNPNAIKYVFKGSVPDSVRQALEAAGIIVEVIP